MIFALSNLATAFIIIPGFIVAGIAAISLEEWWEQRNKSEDE